MLHHLQYPIYAQYVRRFLQESFHKASHVQYHGPVHVHLYVKKERWEVEVSRCYFARVSLIREPLPIW